MQRNAILSTRSVACAGVLLVACGDQATSPTALRNAEATRSASPSAAVVAAAEALPEPFTVRARLDPYFITQAPDLMLRATLAADLAIQRLVTPPSEGAWHTHPGPSFAIVQQGQVMITRYSKKAGCTAEVYGPGDTYYEVAGEVHRASVVGPGDAVEYKVRFNTPFGEPFANPATDPGC